MPRAEIERSRLLRLARWKNISFELEEERVGASGQRGFLFAPAAVRGAKNFRRTQRLRLNGRTKACRLIDEEAIFDGDLPETLQTKNNRFKAQLRIQSESVEGGGRTAGERTSDRRRHYIFAASKRTVLRSGDVSG